MNLSQLLSLLKHDHMIYLKKARHQIKVEDCYKSYSFSHEHKTYHVSFNLLTLDFKSKMPVGLRSKLKHCLINQNYLKWKYKKEARAFFDFIKLSGMDYMKLLITDDESPDFLIHLNGVHGFEVSEATDPHNAKYNEVVYSLTGMEHTRKEFKTYIKHIEKSLLNCRTDYVLKKNVAKDVQVRIIECVEKKAVKYDHYDKILDSKNVIIFNNRIVLKYDHILDLGLKIKHSKIISNSHLDYIIVVNGTHDGMAVFKKDGTIKHDILEVFQ